MKNTREETAERVSPSEPYFQQIDEELQQGNLLQREYNQVLIELTREVKTLQGKLVDLKMASMDTNAIKAILDQHLSAFNNTLKEYPKGRTFRVLFFPEYNPSEYYRLVSAKLMAWLVLILTIWTLFRFGMSWLSVDYQKDRYKQAWEKVYSIQSKVHQQEMDRMLDQ